jgi:hypothetical protein
MKNAIKKALDAKIEPQAVRLVGYVLTIAAALPIWRFKPWNWVAVAAGFYITEKFARVREEDILEERRKIVHDAIDQANHGKPVRTAEFREVHA